MCEKKLGLFSFKREIQLKDSRVTVCNSCYMQLQAMPLPHFTLRTCNSVNFIRFVLIYCACLFFYIACMAAIGVTQCEVDGNDTGCVVGMAIFGMFGSMLCVIAFPLAYWMSIVTSVQTKRDRAAFESWQQGGVVNLRVPSPNQQQQQQQQQQWARAEEKARAIETETEDPPFIPPVAPSAPSAEPLDDDDDDADNDVSRARICTVCMERPRNAVFSPCGHVACCSVCALSIKASKTPACPICRVAIETVVNLRVA
jgi:hypothetical protein